ncbi:hypothetical protein ACJJTC_017159 [Scirpophaga incertulas]
MEGKKISFGFMKTKKVEKPVVEEKKEFIECMEEKSIKIIGGEQVTEAVPLVIPMKPNTLVTAERLKQIAEEVESNLIETESEEKKPTIEPIKTVPENETLDQMAVRELMEDAKKESIAETAVLTVPVQANPVISGQKESTLEDYEDVPIQEFGMAMLRGMGWTPSKEPSKYKHPQLRPKGLGLGADKVVTNNQNKSTKTNEKGEELTIVKNAYVKITSGKYSGYYGNVVSLDDDNGRVMVNLTVKKETVNLTEFMMQPVTKAEFDKESKVINADLFDEYKRNEKVSHKASSDAPRPSKEASSSRRDDYSSRQSDGGSLREKEKLSERRERQRRNSSGSEEKYKKKKEKKKKRYSSSDSLDSLSDSEKKYKHKTRKRDSTSDSDSDVPRRSRKSPVKKRDIDKKRKGKKKKRDRDRSPHYKKYRK